MNNRIYLFGGISFSIVIFAIAFYAYSLTRVAMIPTPQTTVEPVPLVTPSIPNIITPEKPEVESMIIITAPASGTTIQSPLSIYGTARGKWYFEGSFPVELQDAEGKIITTGIATSTGEWMTENYVPFTATLSWANTTATSGTLIFKRDNPSGLPENDASISIPVNF